jgi:pullulanase
MQPLLADAALSPTPTAIAFSRDAFQELLAIRNSSLLFRMTTLVEVQSNLHFLNTGTQQVPGVIVMTLDANGNDFGLYSHILVVFNATTAAVDFQSDTLKGLDLGLHPVQLNSNDAATRESSFNRTSGTASVQGLTTAVFVSR